MKITAGLGSVDDYLPYVEAGADEFFCGYVPYEWMKNGGLTYPLNRREVLYYNVQIVCFIWVFRHLLLEIWRCLSF